MQLEVPIETVQWAAEYAAQRGKTVILDPAPAQKLDDGLIRNSDIITPNETELRVLTGEKTDNEHNLQKAANVLINRGVKTVVNKCGGKGAYLITAQNTTHIKGYEVTAVDTTAAGDSFNAGLAVSLAKDKDIRECIRYANAVGAMAVTKMGAQSAMPTSDELAKFINEYE